MAAEADVGKTPLQFLSEEIKWYETHATTQRALYLSFRVFTLLFGALVAPLTQLGFPLIVTILGIAITVVEGAQQLFQFHDNWTRYRTACEALRHEKILLSGSAAPYDGSDDQKIAQLAQHIALIMSAENGKWQTAQIPPRAP